MQNLSYSSIKYHESIQNQGLPDQGLSVLQSLVGVISRAT